MTKSKISRRSFVKGISAAMAAPYVIRSSALGNQAQEAPSDKITMGAIGLGGRGKHDLTALLANPDVQMVAVCDCQGDRRNQGKEIVNKHYGNEDCETHIDFRELLARDDIDAVLIATGDNNHSLVSVQAAKAGKDIYCEKPMSVVVAEGRATSDIVQRYGVIYQCGTQRRSVQRFAYAVELAQTGKLGELKELYAEKAPPEWFGEIPHEKTLPAQSQPPQEVVDWDQWLGTAPWRPYNKGYMARNFWAGHRDFSGGTITEWGSHTVDLCQWANSADDTTPIEYELAQGTIVAHYANGVKLIFEDGKWPLHVKFVGSEGWIYVDDDGTIEAEPKSLLAGRQFGKGYPNEGHVRNFLDCVKSRRQPIAPPEGAHRANSTCQIANICLRLGRSLKWDPAKEKFDNDPIADRQLVRACRGPWQL